jgi:hypothetical protein
MTVMQEKAKTATQFSSPTLCRTFRKSRSARLYWFDAWMTKFALKSGFSVAKWSAEMPRIPRSRNGCWNPIWMTDSCQICCCETTESSVAYVFVVKWWSSLRSSIAKSSGISLWPLKLSDMLLKLVIRPDVLTSARLGDRVDPLSGFQFGHVQFILRRLHVEHWGYCSSHWKKTIRI